VGLLAFLDRLAKVRDAIRGADPNPHRTVQCVFNYIPNEGIGIGDWKPFLPVIDTFQVDRYPIATETPYFPQGDWGALRVAWQIAHALEAVEGGAHLNPAPVLQGIGLSYFEGGAAHWRDPLYDETRYMAYSALASGGWGTIHWIRGASSPGIRRNVARLYAELRRLLPALEASWERPPFAVSHNHEGITRGFLPDLIPDIATIALEDETSFYLIAVDNSAVFLDVTFRMKLPGMEGKAAREAVVLNEDWGRKLDYDEKTKEWVIPPHTMRYGDVNIWVIGKK